MKHVGKMKNNNAKIVIVYRTLPGDPNSALVVGTSNLGDAYHNALMNLIQDPSGQQANEFADILSVRSFPDGNNMLAWLHNRNQLKKVPTSEVLVTPNPQTSVPLDELNRLIAEQKGVSIEDLAISEGKKQSVAEKQTQVVESSKVTEKAAIPLTEDTSIDISKLSATELRSKADALFKQAQQLRKKAEELDPIKKRQKIETVSE
jgi:hypothetical protein